MAVPAAALPGPVRGGLRQKAQHALAAAALGIVSPGLRSWDARRAAEADRYLVNSTVIRDAVLETYGIEAEVLPPPPAMEPQGPAEPVPIAAPFVLCVARLLPYKNVDVVIRAVQQIAGLSLAVVGLGPDAERLRQLAADSPNIRILGGVSEEELRWLYSECVGLAAASFEDFGLTPLEAAAFGKPTAALRAGGYLDTIDPDVNGVFFDEPRSESASEAIAALAQRRWDASAIADHAEGFSRARFARRLQQVVDETHAAG
ncbi:glycosyltransferase [Nesterenkonia pannonica]|uniref:glycosyltransferase n=1 Tax=Nesterenkonia pannonica TaxID=1548602 RepID=UPI0021645CA5|nr:glycosyltransferase [Nesterenkonia pannonica]